MGKPPTFKMMDGPYKLSPGPAAYTLRNPIDQFDTSYDALDISKRSFSKSKSPVRDTSFEYKGSYKFSTLNSNKIPTHTMTNFLFKESGPRFGSSERKELDIKQKFK